MAITQRDPYFFNPTDGRRRISWEFQVQPNTDTVTLTIVGTMREDWLSLDPESDPVVDITELLTGSTTVTITGSAQAIQIDPGDLIDGYTAIWFEWDFGTDNGTRNLTGGVIKYMQKKD